MTKVCLFLGFFLVSGYWCRGQSGRSRAYGVSWSELEERIRNAAQLEGTDGKLAEIEDAARKAKDYISWTRSLFDRMMIRDRRTEDSSYFRNSAFIDSLLTADSIPRPMRLILHLMQAERVGGFVNRPLKFNGARYETPDQLYDYAAMSRHALDSIAQEHFKEAKANSSLLDSAEPGALLWLSSSPQTFLFRPSWRDIVLADEIDLVLKANRSGNIWKGARGIWLGLASAAFIDTLKANAGTVAPAGLFAEWLRTKEGDPHAYHYIEAVARKSLYQDYSYDTAIIRLYESYLSGHSGDTLAEVRAFAIYQLCLGWHQQTMQEEEWQFQEYGWDPRSSTWSMPKHTPGNTLGLYEDNKETFAPYPYLRKALEVMRAQILQAKLRISVSHENLPGEPIRVRITCKNTARFYYRIIRVGQHDTLPTLRKKLNDYLLSKPAVRDTVVDLALPDDHALHGPSLSTDELPAGRYCLLASGSPLAGASDLTTSVEFKVGELVVLQTDGNAIHVLDRRSGFPVPGVIVNGRLTSEKGFVRLKNDDADTVQASYHGDTTIVKVAYDEEAVDPDDEKTKEDAVEFYDDNLHIFAFTDRAIYRPGQTVHFKIILTTKNIRTAEPMLLTQRNLRTGGGKHGLESWLREYKPVLYLNDPNDRQTDSAAIRPDDYGSFSGSFVIPKDASTGKWELATDRGAAGGSFRVEEYKRPSFQVRVLPPDSTYLPGEPLTFKMAVRYFTGASAANTMVRYTVKNDDGILADTTVPVNADGSLKVRIEDTAANRHPRPDSVIRRIHYSLSVTATDITGESHDAESQLDVSNRPVSIIVPDRATYLLDDSPLVNIEAKDLNGLSLAKTLQVKVYKKRISDSGIEIGKDLVYTTNINTGVFEKLAVSADHWQGGEYEMDLECREGGHLLGKRKVNWTVLDRRSPDWSFAKPFLLHVGVNSVKHGDKVHFYTGSRFDSGYTLINIKYYTIKHGRSKAVSIFLDRHTRPGLQEWNWTVPGNADGLILITSLIVHRGELYRNSSRMWVNVPAERPLIRIERFSEHLSPGETTQFSISVRTGNTAIAAQVMSAIYDASLDRLEPHDWRLPMISDRPEVRNSWPYPYEWNSQAVGLVLGTIPKERPMSGNKPSWRSDGFEPVNDMALSLEGRVAGFFTNQPNGLNDVLVVGYGTTSRRLLLSSSVITIRGTNSLPEMDSHILIILDGVEYKDDIKKINLQTITQGLILQGVEATRLYGSRAAHGVLLLSTRGEIKLPGSPEPVVRIRKNFNETAFFSPAIKRGRNGYYTFRFTLPESVTEWAWQIMAHTKKALFAYATKKFDTRLPLMIQPHLPRFIYQGDRIILKSRISNLDTLAMQGQASYTLEDAVTGEDVSSRMLSKTAVPFSAPRGGSCTVSLVLRVPKGMLHPLRITIKATTGSFADAEEHVIPVLSTRILVRRSFPYRLAANRDTLLRLPAPASGDSLLGIGVAVAAPPASALLNALPWLANYSYDCAEQTFNKMLAHITALELMRSDTSLRMEYARSVQDTLSFRRQPDEPALRNMPWLDLVDESSRQHRELRIMLDTVRTIAAIEAHLKRLYRMQRSDGGVSWFDNGQSSPYISAYLLAGFGGLRTQSWRPTSAVAGELDSFLSALVHYSDGVYSSGPDLNYVYARTFWLEDHPLTNHQRSVIRNYLASLWAARINPGLYSDALLIICSMAYFDRSEQVYKKALEQLQNIREMAITDETGGIRWKELADDDDLTTCSEETISMLCKAFEHSPGYAVFRAGILKWLLEAQADHHWSSTKATAAVMGLLKQETGTVAGLASSVTARIADTVMHLSTGRLQGMPLAFVQGSASSKVRLSVKNGMAAGHVIQYYFTAPEQLQRLNSTVKLSKHLFRYSDSSHLWEPLAEHPVVHVADKIKVVLTLETAKPLRYVYINDTRAASFEPTDIRSSYSYDSGFPLYRSVRDAGYQFFADLIPSGRWQISYEVRAEQEGEFSGGAAMLQCMYKPELTAYSQSGGVEVRP